MTGRVMLQSGHTYHGRTDRALTAGDLHHISLLRNSSVAAARTADKVHGVRAAPGTSPGCSCERHKQLAPSLLEP